MQGCTFVKRDATYTKIYVQQCVNRDDGSHDLHQSEFIDG